MLNGRNSVTLLMLWLAYIAYVLTHIPFPYHLTAYLSPYGTSLLSRRLSLDPHLLIVANGKHGRIVKYYKPW